MIFNPIAIDNWSRKPYFEHYLNNVRCTFSMTANIDITRLLSELKKKGIKLYPALIHMISTIVNRHNEFRVNKQLINDHTQTRTISLMVFR